MQQSSSTAACVTTAGLLLETSLGSLTIDILGADCPALSGNFLNLCRAELWNGAVATEVIPEIAVFFSLTADPVYHHLLRGALHHHCSSSPADASSSTGGKSAVLSFWSLLPRQESDPTAVNDAAKSRVRHALPGTSALWPHDTPKDPVTQRESAFEQAVQQEARVCKRRRCVGLSRGESSVSRTNNSRGSSGSANVGGGPRHGDAGLYQPVFTSVSSTAVSPCTVCRAGSLIVDITAPVLRFGLTLSNRTVDFLDKQYVVIGYVREGEAVLRRMQRAPLRDSAVDTTSHVHAAPTQEEDFIAGRVASAWPQPARMLRVKRALVLPTAGTEKFFTFTTAAWTVNNTAGSHDRRQRAAEALHQAGCFAWWASATTVRAAHRQLVRIVQMCLLEEQYTAPTRPTTVAEATALLQSSSTMTPAATVKDSSSSSSIHPPAQTPYIILQKTGSIAEHSNSRKQQQQQVTDPLDSFELSYNAHFTGPFLSSEDEDDVYGGATTGGAASSHALQLSAKQLEERRRLFMQQHQEKANETLSLMLNVLNGVADTHGDIRPPENVLFVCKLNPVTTAEGLALCFAQFGRVVSADVIHDSKTKQSLCYGFVEFESVEACFRAFQKMDQALIDDCRIHVDFSQSVSKLWAQRQREMRKRHRSN